MTLEECVAKFEVFGLTPNCILGAADQSLSWPDIAIIATAIAVAGATVIAFFQLKSLKDGTLRQVEALIIGSGEQARAMKRAARLRATLDVLMHSLIDGEWRQRRQKFIELRDGEDGLKKFALRPELRNSVDALIIRSQLNTYEVISLGMKEGILDEEMIKMYYRGTFIRDFQVAREYIEIRRKDNTKFWIIFQEFAERWERET